MATVFISYSRKDIDFAKRLTAELQKSELDFWIDWEGIPPTVDWWREIEKGIEESDAFIFLISPDSTRSKVCGQEIDHAVKNGKRLIPIVIREVNASEIHSKLNPLNWIFFREADDFSTSVTKLLDSIHTDYEWVQTHRRLQVRALEWERIHKENSFLLRGKDLQDAELQLTTNSSKEPYPTDLQREYVFESRKAVDRQRRITTTISIVGVIAMTALAVFGFSQAKVATDRANIALARQLVAQAQSVYAADSSDSIIAVLLSVQSMKVFPTDDAASFLLNNNHASQQLSQMAHNSTVNSVAFSPDGKFVVSGSYDNTARVWEAATGNEIARLTHNSEVTSATFSPDGKFVVSGSYDGTAHVWEAATGNEIARMTHDYAVSSVAFSPDGKFVVSGSYDNTARVWEASTGDEIARMTHNNGVSSVAFSPDGKLVVSGSYDGTARVWETTTGKEIARMIHDDWVSSVAFSPDGVYVVSGSYDGTARVWEAATGKETSRITYDFSVTSVAFSPNGEFVASGGCDQSNANYYCTQGTTRVWVSATGEEITRLPYGGQISSVAFSPDGEFVVSGGCNLLTAQDFCTQGIVRVWVSATGVEVASMIHDFSVTSVAFSPTGKYVVSGSEDATARVWEVATLRLTHDYDVLSVAFSPDGKYVLSDDGAVHVWEVAAGKEIASTIHQIVVTPVASSPDGKFVVSSSGDTVHVWEAATEQEITRLIHGGQVTSVAFSPDGEFVISGSRDHTARVWEIATGMEIARMIHHSAVLSVAFSPDGKYVVSGSTDNTALVWVWQARDLIANACAVVPHNLTRAEWRIYIGDALPYQAVCDNLPIESEITAMPTP